MRLRVMVFLVVVACGQIAMAQSRAGAKRSATESASMKAMAQAPVAGEQDTSGAPEQLPVRSVVLYKSGVGFFQHVGRIRGDEAVRIDFNSGQLDDVLGSLTVLDLNGGRITGIGYNSEAPFSQRLSALGLPLEENTDLGKFLEALRGTRVEIRDGNSSITGRLLSVEQKTRTNDRGMQEAVNLATLVSDTGEVHTVEVTPAVQVLMADADTKEDVSRYLSLLASQHQQELRRMTISTAGTGERELYVSYVSETPIWKTSYRIVLPTKAGEEPLLQGWAIVDNTTGEDWNDVELSLVAGAPDSFIQQLSQPYYARRPVVPLPQAVELTPQTHESAMSEGGGSLSGTVTDPTGAVVAGTEVQVIGPNGQVVDTDTTDDSGRYELDGLAAGTYRIQFTKQGFQTLVESLGSGGGRQTLNATLQVGAAMQTVEVESEAAAPMMNDKFASRKGIAGGIAGGAPVPPPLAMPALMNAMQQMSAAAKGASLGDLFQYKLKDRVTIHKNESALVPIVQTHVEAEKVSLWNSSLGSERPLRALWLTNSSALTLDGGSFTVLEENTFAGEGLTEPIKPNEKRLISYAADLGARVTENVDSEPQNVTHVRISRGVMFQTRELRQNTTYTVRDDDTTPRVVLIEHPVRAGWKLAADAPKPAETTPGVYRFRVELKPKQTEKLSVNEAAPQETTYALSNLTNDQIELFVRQKEINPTIEAALVKIMAQKNVVAGLAAQIAALNGKRQRIFADQQRIRENLKALKGTAEEKALIERYTQQLANQENQLEALQKQEADLESKRAEAQADLDKMVQNLTLDETI